MQDTIEKKLDAPNGRNGLIDTLRFLCAIGIVWFHSGAPGNQIAYTALPFFLVLLAMPSRGRLRDRAKRLLRPWLIWSTIFAIGEVLRAYLRDQDLFSWFQPTMVLYGTMIHLWFLPFAFIAGYILTPLRAWPHLALIAPLITAILVTVGPHSPTLPFPQWLFGAVPAVVGAAFFAQENEKRWLAFPALLIAFLVLEMLQPGIANLVILIGCTLALGSFLIRTQANRLTNLAAKVSFPIYLSHPIFLYAGREFHFEGYTLAGIGIMGSIGYGLLQVLLLSSSSPARKRG